MSFQLPSIFALSSPWFDNYYLNYSSDSDSETLGFLKFNGKDALSTLAKFEVVKASTGTGQVHIRCSHNRKFLRTRTEGHPNLSPEADEPEEDQSKWSCTLFEPRVLPEDGNSDIVRLFHVGRKQYAEAWNEGEGENKKFLRLFDSPSQQGFFHITNLESLVILPSIFALSSPWFDNYYLNYSDDSDSETLGYLKFNGTDAYSSLAKFEVVKASAGTRLVHIRCSFNGKFLRTRTEGHPNLSPEADEPEEDQSKWSCTLFEPRVLPEDGSPDIIHLFHVGRKQYAEAWNEGEGENKKFLKLYDTPTQQGFFYITNLE
ncbi:uncharacterized protein LOC126797357 [Argentina anserina]|uniref:uncharacterized protein LOC126797357 n=1 Tax=Argentina anserina TaxID=57926 RepID=UPI00217646CB|nr:uncharacterized protein LOC126797357 [Potentilla anserina]